MVSNYNAARRDTAQRVIAGVLSQWGLGLVAHMLAKEIVDRLDKAGYLKGVR